MEATEIDYSNCIQEVAPGVYAGKGFTDAGEPIYFGMERIHSGNMENWKFYLKSTTWMAQEAGGILPALLGLMANGKDIPYNLLGYDDKADFDPMRARIENRAKILGGLAEEQHNGRMNFQKLRQQIASVTRGAEFCHPFEGNYIVYASKKPINGPFDFSKVQGMQRAKLKLYDEVFGHILMAFASSDVNETNVENLYSNRGIFRSPLNWIDGTHSGIAILLHAFSGAAVKRINPEKTLLLVQPLSSMQHVLFGAFEKENENDLMIGERQNDGSYAHVPFRQSQLYAEHQTKGWRNVGTIVPEPGNFIKIEALIRIYLRYCHSK